MFGKNNHKINTKLWIFGLFVCFIDLGAAQLRQGSANCGTVRSTGVTQDEVDAIINAHNELRQRVAQGKETRGNPGPQPAATNMRTLQWDDTLASDAQTWADQCLVQHYAAKDSRFAVGQNWAWVGTTSTEPTSLSDMVQSWYNEVVNVNLDMVKSFDGSKADEYGHYSQLVWGDTEYVGCGVTRYNKDNWEQTFLICKYGPAGNILGNSLYNIA